jgi:DNA invertase Pin-like site-specific DNA recombinase
VDANLAHRILEALAMRYAISYKRFSSPKQARGDSDRRQSDLTEEYCRRRRLKLIDTYLDAGLSGFTGENMSDGGALRALLCAANDGKFKPGTHLIVESLDRLSRREISTAVRLFLDILDTGLVIVTLIDGEEVFTKRRVDNDLTALIIAIVYLARANNESRNRSERALQAQRAARQKARERKIPITAECPRWLTVVGKGDARHFIVDRQRARVIEQIYRMAASGTGQIEIATFLNQHDVPTLNERAKWRAGMVAHVLRSQAVIGSFHPCLSVMKNGRRWRVPDPDGPIENYFPAVISKEMYLKGRLGTGVRTAHRGNRHLPAYRNLVARLGHCALCGGSIHHSGNASGWSYLRCGSVRYKECSNLAGVPYRKVESVLLALDRLTDLIERLIAMHAVGSAPGRRRSAKVVNEISDYEREVRRIELLDREAFFARFPTLTVAAESADSEHRDPARRVLIAGFRRFIDGVVLHPDRSLTVHMRLDPAGHRVVYIIDRDGIQGAQVKAPEGKTGFIDRYVLTGLVRPVKRGPAVRAKEALWQPSDPDHVIKRIRLVDSPDGDWHALAADPMQIAEIVGRAERTLVI